MTSETKLPDGLQLAIDALEPLDEESAFESWLEFERPHGDVEAVQRQWENSTRLKWLLEAQTAASAIRAEHAKRVTLQHHCADQAQRIADLEQTNGMHATALLGFQMLGHYMEAIYCADRIPTSSLGKHYGDAAVERMQGQDARIAELEAERDALSEELNEWRFTNAVDVMRRESDQLRRRAELAEQRCAVLVDADEPRTEQLRAACRERDELRRDCAELRNSLALETVALRAHLDGDKDREIERLTAALYSIDRQLGHDDADDALRDEITAALGAE